MDVNGGEAFDQAVAILHQRVHPLRRLTVIGIKGEQPDLTDSGKPPDVLTIDARQTFNARFQPGQLSEADARLHVGQFEVKSNARMNVVPSCAAHGASLIFQLTHSYGKRLIIGYDQTSLPGRDRLVRRERETAGEAEGAETLPPVTRSKRLRRIFNHDEAARGRDLQDSIDRRRPSADMDRHDRLRPRG